jgi:hypothetical protein
MIPIGLNTTEVAVRACGGPAPYYARLRGVYNVSRIMGNMNDSDIKFLKECQGPALDNGIQLLPMLLFPSPFIWTQTYMSIIYPDLNKFWQMGEHVFTDRACEMLNALDWRNLFAVEILNEVQFDTMAKVEFAVKAMQTLRESYFTSLPLTVSRPFPTGLNTIYERTVTKEMNIVTFHTYGAGNMDWYFMPERNEWDRLVARLAAVKRACDLVAQEAMGKPFICTEDPILPVRGWWGDLFAALFRAPKDKDFAAHYVSVCKSYVANGAMGPGMPWSNCNQDVPNGYIEALRNSGL